MRPSIPSGFSTKLMIGLVTTSLSRTAAKCPERRSLSALTPPIAPAAAALLAPRWAIALVTSWKAERP